MKKLFLITYFSLCATFYLEAQNSFPGIGDVGIGDDSSILDHTNQFYIANFLDPKITVYQDRTKYLTENTGDYQILTSFGGWAGNSNLIWENTYIYRDTSGTNWFNSRIHNGIAVDTYFSVPHESNYWQSTLTWWERDPRDDIQAWGNAGTTHMVLDKGKLGIGTTSPDSKLTVKGNIHSNEVKVDLLGAVAPDYVFYKDYDLKTLKEVETYISEKGHLPNIPSAKDMEEDGIKLKEMNLKLLQKIEELTLYTIGQEKEIITLKKKTEKVGMLEKELQNQKDRLQKIEILLESKKK